MAEMRVPASESVWAMFMQTVRASTAFRSASARSAAAPLVPARLKFFQDFHAWDCHPDYAIRNVTAVDWARAAISAELF